MAVQRSCTTDTGTVILNGPAGEYIEYRIPQASPGVEYQVALGSGGTVLTSADCPPPCTRRWPASGTADGTDHLTFGVQFLGDQAVELEVDHMDAQGQVLAELKRCRYVNSGGPDDYYDPLEVISV